MGFHPVLAKHLPLPLAAMGAEGVRHFRGALTACTKHLQNSCKKYAQVGLWLSQEIFVSGFSAFLLSLAANFSPAGGVNDDFSIPDFTMWPC